MNGLILREFHFPRSISVVDVKNQSNNIHDIFPYVVLIASLVITTKSQDLLSHPAPITKDCGLIQIAWALRSDRGPDLGKLCDGSGLLRIG